MSRLLLLVVLMFAAVQFAPAQSFPKFPQQAHVTTAEHVKNYWTRTLRWQARSTRNRSTRANKQHLIKQIDAGHFDDYAELVAQRGNLIYLEFHNRMIAVQGVKRKIALLKEGVFAAEPDPFPAAVLPAPRQARPGNRDPDPIAVPLDPEIVLEDEEDCPPPSQLDSSPRQEVIYLTPSPQRPKPIGQRPTHPGPQREPHNHRSIPSKPSPQFSKTEFVLPRRAPTSRPSPAPPSRPQSSPVVPRSFPGKR